ncbi:hypothetical protein [Actinomadura violacea]|uniref:Peptidase M48 domain-containing protein n=1 Tax=Actinomadura violacea TaxID=2819934 RepID=A0ABS3S721_9ACTN|nr:hypothetical protein [Actinomadura violacea]MBO2464005.1 hypothetical protein [Actinomadura violacea]
MSDHQAGVSAAPAPSADTPDDEFGAAVRRAFLHNLVIRRLASVYVLPPLTLMLGAAIRLAVGPGLAAGAAAVIAALMATPVIINALTLRPQRHPKLRALPADAAEEHLRRAAARMSPETVRAIIAARAQASVRLRVDHLPVYCTEPDDPPKLRIGGAVLLQGPLIIIGDAMTTSQTDWVLAHEVQHTTRFQRRIHLLWSLAMTVGWILLGLLLAPPILPAAGLLLAVVLIAVAWGREIGADIAAARQACEGAADWCALALGMARRAPWYQRTLLASPIHPPLRLRALYTRRITGRARLSTKAR